MFYESIYTTADTFLYNRANFNEVSETVRMLCERQSCGEQPATRKPRANPNAKKESKNWRVSPIGNSTVCESRSPQILSRFRPMAWTNIKKIVVGKRFAAIAQIQQIVFPLLEIFQRL
jgi:hypothetical protein